jgi:hypothetical protein
MNKKTISDSLERAKDLCPDAIELAKSHINQSELAAADQAIESCKGALQEAEGRVQRAASELAAIVRVLGKSNSLTLHRAYQEATLEQTSASTAVTTAKSRLNAAEVTRNRLIRPESACRDIRKELNLLAWPLRNDIHCHCLRSAERLAKLSAELTEYTAKWYPVFATLAQHQREANTARDSYNDLAKVAAGSSSASLRESASEEFEKLAAATAVIKKIQAEVEAAQKEVVAITLLTGAIATLVDAVQPLSARKDCQCPTCKDKRYQEYLRSLKLPPMGPA